MAAGIEVLDRTLRKVTPIEYAPPAYYVNHGPMACEALVVLGADAAVVDGWADAYRSSLPDGPGPAPSTWATGTDWRNHVGDRRRLPEWLTYFAGAVDADWRSAVAEWVPRFLPALSSALYHGVIRTSHAVRAIDSADTPARRAELAWALAKWAIWFHPGADIEGHHHTADADDPWGTVAAAARGARAYAVEPSIAALHGITVAMAVDLLTAHLRARDGAAALIQLRADHDDLYGPDGARASAGTPSLPTAAWPDAVTGAAMASHDPHQVKLVEACRRAYGRTGEDAFVQAATTVTGVQPAAA